MIEDELSKDPLALGDDPQKYLQSRMEQFNITEAGFDRNLFFERLIVPGYQQGICRLVARHGIPLALFGARGVIFRNSKIWRMGRLKAVATW